MDNTIVTIILDEKEALKYKQFLEYYDIFSLLLDKKVFNQKSAALTINFDNKGKIGTITRNDVLYLSNIPFDNIN